MLFCAQTVEHNDAAVVDVEGYCCLIVTAQLLPQDIVLFAFVYTIDDEYGVIFCILQYVVNELSVVFVSSGDDELGF